MTTIVSCWGFCGLGVWERALLGSSCLGSVLQLRSNMEVRLRRAGCPTHVLVAAAGWAPGVQLGLPAEHMCVIPAAPQAEGASQDSRTSYQAVDLLTPYRPE